MQQMSVLAKQKQAKGGWRISGLLGLFPPYYASTTSSSISAFLFSSLLLYQIPMPLPVNFMIPDKCLAWNRNNRKE
jgi:hypothetical protein